MRVRQWSIEQRPDGHAAKEAGDDELPAVGIGGAKFAGNGADGRQHGVDRHRHHGVEQRHKEDEFLRKLLVGIFPVHVTKFSIPQDVEDSRRFRTGWCGRRHAVHPGTNC